MHRILTCAALALHAPAGAHAQLSAPGQARLLPDTLVLAESAFRACGTLERTAKQACYEKRLVPLVASHGVRTAMGTLNRLGGMDAMLKVDGHVYSHGIGIAAGQQGQKDNDVAKAFVSCTEIFQSGCYHGVIQAYFETVHSVDTASVNALCQPWSQPGGDMWLRFQCAHGMGHGLTMFYGHDLPQALDACNLHGDQWDRDSCLGGAFMENIVNATSPHHPASAMQHDHAMAGMPGMNAKPAFKPLDAKDPHYPCSVVAERYVVQCYTTQTSAMLLNNHGDMAATARLCRQAPASARYICHQSLGRDISSYSMQKHDKAIAMCSLSDAEFQPWCHAGVAKNFIDLTAKTEDGIAYCRAVSGERNRFKCYEAVGEQVGILRATPEGGTALCGSVEETYRPACLFGARVTGERPPGIPMPATTPR